MKKEGVINKIYRKKIESNNSGGDEKRREESELILIFEIVFFSGREPMK